jgi:hypothetical protein
MVTNSKSNLQRFDRSLRECTLLLVLLSLPSLLHAANCVAVVDGQRVACGGEAVTCQSSPDGSHIACGGEAVICQSGQR